jgi:hypothetical protein
VRKRSPYPILDKMKARRLPLTREVYLSLDRWESDLELAPEEEAALPPQFRKDPPLRSTQIRCVIATDCFESAAEREWREKNVTLCLHHPGYHFDRCPFCLTHAGNSTVH